MTKEIIVALTGDQLHQRFKRRLAILPLFLIACFVSAEWMNAVSRQDLSQHAPWRMFLIAGGVSLAAFLGLVILLLLTFRIYWQVKKDPAARAAFNDEFHRETERKSAMVGFVVTLLTMVAMTGLLTIFPSATTSVQALMITMSVSASSFVGAYLYFERGQ